MIDEMRKTMGPNSEALEKLKSDIEAKDMGQRTLESSILSLFQLKADTSQLEEYKKNAADSFMTRSKGTSFC
jgi:hypothetical protein